MGFQETGQVDVRQIFIDGMLKGFAKRAYKLKTVVNVQTTGAWINYFFRASPDTLTAGRNANVKGVPPGAAIPQASTSFEKIRTDIEKYALQDTISWEDIIAGQVNVRDQTLMRIAEGIVYAIDSQIWTGLTTDSGIQTFTIANKPWNVVASANIIDDLEYAEQLIASWNYPTSNLKVLISPLDKRSIVNFLVAKGTQVPQLANTAVDNPNGIIGTIGNKTFIVSMAVAASQVLVVVPQICATWKELVSLSTDITTVAFKGTTVTAAELGVLQVDNPKSMVLIKGTQ